MIPELQILEKKLKESFTFLRLILHIEAVKVNEVAVFSKRFVECPAVLMFNFFLCSQITMFEIFE